MIPPPRIAIIGAIGSGKTTLAKQLSLQWKVPYVNFEEFCRAYETTVDIREDIKTSISDRSAISSTVMGAILTDLFIKEV